MALCSHATGGGGCDRRVRPAPDGQRVSGCCRGRAGAVRLHPHLLLIYVFVRDSPAERGLPSLADIADVPPPPSATGRAMPLGQRVLVVFREPNTWLLGSYAFLLFGTMTMMQGLWAVPYLMDVYGQSQQEAANALTLWAVGLIVGCTLWGYCGRPDRRLSQARGARGRRPVRAPLGLSRPPPGRIAGRPAVGGDVLGWLLRLDLDSFLCAAQGHGPTPGRRDRDGNPQPLRLARWRRLSAGQRIDPGGVSQAGRNTPVSGYQALFWSCLASVGLSVVLVALSKDGRSVPSATT
jgi:hypothetical protein